MPWIDPDVLDSTIYLYPSEAAAQDGERIGGTGFLIGVPVIARNREIGNVICVVTNKHVIDHGNTVARLNTHDQGTDIIPLDGLRWYTHPDGDDLAVCPIRLNSRVHKAKLISVRNFATKKTIEANGIGPGDDVFIVGRFINHEGKQRNLPSVRFGNIAQMPWEPIVIDGVAQESFLIEARSISGYSGSPVFGYVMPPLDLGLNPEIKKMIREGQLQMVNVNPKRADLPIPLGPWLLGINYCYIRWDEPIWSRITQKPVSEEWFVKSNTGMMGVIPSWRLLDILTGPEMKPLLDNAKKAVEEVTEVDAVIKLDVTDLSPPRG